MCYRNTAKSPCKRDPSITVVGSVNLDLVAQVERLPRPGETVTDAVFRRVPGGKGANQAVACARLGADVTLVCSVGDDLFAAEALPQEERLTVDAVRVAAPTGVAVILVDAEGENQIAVAPGANAEVRSFELAAADAVLTQLELPDAAVIAAWEQATGLFCLNAAPARPIDVDADLTVVNRYELEVLKRRDGLVALTLGAEGAVLLQEGEEIARAEPPRVEAVDGTAAGDAFTACLLVSLLEGRDHDEALRRACAAGALAASRFGAQPSLPTAAEIDEILAPVTPVIIDCDPGHDDAIALLLALASPEIDLVGVTTVHGNQTLDKTTDNALRVLALVGREDVPLAMGADRPLVREPHVAAHVHGESGLDGPELPQRASEPIAQHAVDFLVERVTPETVLVPLGPLTNVALRARPRACGRPGSC